MTLSVCLSVCLRIEGLAKVGRRDKAQPDLVAK